MESKEHPTQELCDTLRSKNQRQRLQKVNDDRQRIDNLKFFSLENTNFRDYSIEKSTLKFCYAWKFQLFLLFARMGAHRRFPKRHQISIYYASTHRFFISPQIFYALRRLFKFMMNFSQIFSERWKGECVLKPADTQLFYLVQNLQFLTLLTESVVICCKRSKIAPF